MKKQLLITRMNRAKIWLIIAICAIGGLTSIQAQTCDAEGGEITGGPFEFVVDGAVDNVSGIGLSGNNGTNSTWVITDAQGTILGLPPTLAAVEGVNFDSAGAGVCLIWHLSFEDGLTGAMEGNNASDLEGCFDLSNPIEVIRSSTAVVDGGTLTGGPFEILVDGVPDMIPTGSITLEGAEGANMGWVITDDALNILGLPATLSDVEGVNFDAAGTGTCLIWHISHDGSLSGAAMGANAADLKGNFNLSNSVEVIRKDVSGGTITGGPFEFTVDGTADMIPAGSITLEGAAGSDMAWVITDAELNILGIPPTLADVEGVNFDGAGPGVCLIWHISHDGSLTGATMGANAADLGGNFDLSNSIAVIRSSTDTVAGGTLTGGPFEFTVDGTADMIPAGSITLEGAEGTNMGWVITDADLNILGLPPTLAAVEGVDFDGAGVGVCLIWHISHDGSLFGAEPGANAADLEGNFSLSNSIEVIRSSTAVVDGGTLTGGPFEILVDGVPDMIPTGSITLEGAEGANMGWVITDDALNILGLPATLSDVEGVNFDAAGTGTCLIWHISHDGSLSGAAMGANAANLKGNFNLSNSVEVIRKDVSGGTITGGPFEFTVDGTADMIPAGSITLEGAAGSDMAWVITDAELNILGVPATLADVEGVNFDGAGPGVCLIWHISHDGSLTGATMGANAADLGGNFDLSNSIAVIRSSTDTVDGGILTGGPFTFCAGDGTADNIPEGGITLEGAVGAEMAWVVTDADGNILGLPPTFSAVDFDGAGAGTCLVWHISHDGSLFGAEVGANAADLAGNFNLSNPITVERVSGSDCDVLSVDDIEQGLSLVVFPSPASSVLNIQLNSSFKDDLQIELYNLLGQKVRDYKSSASEDLISVNINDLEAGMYVLNVQNQSGQQGIRKQIVIE